MTAPITDKRVEAALEFLNENAPLYGDLIGQCKALEEKKKTVRGEAFLLATGTVAEREAIACTSQEYRQVTKEIQNAWAESKTLELQIKAREYLCDVYRTQQANKRKTFV